MSAIPVTVLASDPILQTGLSGRLGYQPEVDLVEQGRARVALIVMDLLDDGAVQQIRRQRRQADCRVVVVCGRATADDVLAAVEAGACALLRRSEATQDRLVATITAAANGGGVMPPDLLGRLLETIGSAQRHVLAPRGLQLAALSDRERRVLELVAEGHSTREIARRLSYSERTIKDAIHNLVTRLQLRNRAHAVAWATREGYI